jgi:hypothetical protein
VAKAEMEAEAVALSDGEGRDLPSGAHRVPPAFRHLLKRTLEEAGS